MFAVLVSSNSIHCAKTFLNLIETSKQANGSLISQEDKGKNHNNETKRKVNETNESNYYNSKLS